MRKRYYIPDSDFAKSGWLKNMALKLGVYQPTLGLTPADVTSVQNDAAMFNYVLDMQEAFKTFKQDLSKYKDLLRDGPGMGSAGPLPAAPVLPPAPIMVNRGIFKRIRLLVSRIKGSTAYNQAIGEDLGIIGDEQVIDIPNLKPVLNYRIDAGRVLIIWYKGVADSIDIYADRKDGQGMKYLANDSQPDYLDTFELPEGTASAVWEYQAIYRIADAQVGQFSDVMKVTVSQRP